MKHLLRNITFLTTIAIASLVYGIESSQTTSFSPTPFIKNIIFLIGDGMGYGQVGLLNTYAKHALHSPYPERTTALEKAIASGTLGMVHHEAEGVLVTDSAASATQIASGLAAGVEMIGVDHQGNRVTTILELAQQQGKSTGLVSDTRITHATPAAFAAHQTYRDKENEIAVDLLNSNVDVMLSGGLRHWLPQHAAEPTSSVHKELKSSIADNVEMTTKRQDERNLLAEARQKGYHLVFNRTQLLQVEGQKILGLFTPSEMPSALEERRDRDDPQRKIPFLKEMMVKALEVLSKNEKGFFLMVESGQIDWASHSNDAGALLHEMLKFDELVNYLTQWIQGRNDTVIFITADHETGGFGFNYSHHHVPPPQELSGSMFHNKELFKPNFGQYSILDQLYEQKLSYQTLLQQFAALPLSEQTAKKLATLIHENIGVKVTAEEVAIVLKPDSLKETVVYSENLHSISLSRVLGKYQNTVWATNTHTSTPVPLVVMGPKEITVSFGKILHTTEWGQLAIQLLKK